MDIYKYHGGEGVLQNASFSMDVGEEEVCPLPHRKEDISLGSVGQ